MPHLPTSLKPPVRAVVVVAALATAITTGWYYTSAELPLHSALAAEPAVPEAPAVANARVLSKAVAPETTFVARLRHGRGASDLLELLDAQRNAQQAEIGLN